MNRAFVQISSARHTIFITCSTDTRVFFLEIPPARNSRLLRYREEVYFIMKSESEKNMLNNKKVETYSRGPNKMNEKKRNETRKVCSSSPKKK